MSFRRHIAYFIWKNLGEISFFRRVEWKSILEWLDPKNGEKILDVGCGSGELILKIAKKGSQVYGIDISEEDINNSKDLARRSNLAAKFQVADALNLPYPDNYFDKIVSSSCLEHFIDDIKALKEMKRVLKPKGYLVLTTDSFHYLSMGKVGERHKKIANVVNYYTAEELNNRMEIAGFLMIGNKYLMKSSATTLFHKIGIKFQWKGSLWYIISLMAYPLCAVSERLSKKGTGYTLIAKASRIM